MNLTQSSQAATSSIPKKGGQILQNAINSFRTVLTPEQLAEFENIQSVPDTDPVLVFTAELDLRQQNQKGKSIASRLFPVLQAVHSFTSIIETFVSSNPTIAVLIWGSVKMTMMIMLNAAPYYEAFVELCMELGRICPEVRAISGSVPRLRTPTECLVHFQRLHHPMLSARHCNAEKIDKNVSKEIRLAADQSQHRNNEFKKMENKQADRCRRSLSRFMSRTRDDFDTMQKLQIMKRGELERENNQKLLDSLSSYDYIKPLKHARQKRYPKSAEWIFRTDEFERWVDGTTPGLLWCSGKMGSGKSIICASVINYLLTERSGPQSHVTFFFSRFDDSESMRAETVLRSLPRQLVTIQDVSGDTKRALEAIQSAPEDISSEISPLLTRLLSRNGSPSWVIVDGIDEYHKEERQTLTKVLKSMLSEGVNVRLFITSRDYANYIFKAEHINMEQVYMNCSLDKLGMAQLVDQAVQKCLDAEELLVSDQALIAKIKNTFAKHADGMILWVTLFLRHLCSQPNNEKIRKAIAFKSLSRNLTAIFNRILYRTISDGKDSIVQAILPWIAAAKQPLTLSQLEECCLISPLQEYIIQDRYVNGIHRIDTWFQGLVEIDYETKTVHFIHACVQQFFLTASDKPALSNFHVRIQDADRHIGDICVTYLNFSDFKTTLAQIRPLLLLISPDKMCQEALSNEWSLPRFLRLSQRIRGPKRRAADIKCNYCFIAAHDGHLEIIKALSEAGVNINNEYGSISGYPNSLPLIEAVKKGHIKVIEYFLQKGANPNSQNHLRESALVQAARLGASKGLQACRLLIDAGANARDTDALLKSCARGDKDIIRLLLSAGADVNASYPVQLWIIPPYDCTLVYQGTTALLESFSVRQPEVDITELLIGAGAKINIGSSEDSGYRLLREAITSLNINLVKILIREGADPSGRPRLDASDTPLALAASGSLFEIMHYLLDNGARVIDFKGIVPHLTARQLELVCHTNVMEISPARAYAKSRLQGQAQAWPALKSRIRQVTAETFTAIEGKLFFTQRSAAVTHSCLLTTAHWNMILLRPSASHPMVSDSPILTERVVLYDSTEIIALSEKAVSDNLAKGKLIMGNLL
ncbi:NACHT domain-containing protein [Fusarium circinatum]|uniref:NACHT domain-containing protein n=1 Tax=Fusarium circinatum TaxID=48490 RepID=A0A8H5U100_FUSCI|nr:NACHT domain-containing protein [Fusarium circinatum]